MDKEHVAAIGAAICITIWGLTFIFSKELMVYFTPIQLMSMRFLIAFLVLLVICPKMEFDIKKEWVYVLIALFGNLIYYLAENVALTYTYASEVSILTSTTSMMSLVLMFVLFKDRIMKLQVIGFVVSFIGVVLVTFNGTVILNLDPIGDILSLAAALSWAIYCVLLRLFSKDIDGRILTRKMMFYGFLMTIPLMIIDGHGFNTTHLFDADTLVRLFFLGVLGSGLCFILWNHSVKVLGVVKSNIFIYAMPAVTLIAGRVVFDETITIMAVIGVAMIIMGMVMANRDPE